MHRLNAEEERGCPRSLSVVGAGSVVPAVTGSAGGSVLCGFRWVRCWKRRNFTEKQVELCYKIADKSCRICEACVNFRFLGLTLKGKYGKITKKDF